MRNDSMREYKELQVDFEKIYYRGLPYYKMTGFRGYTMPELPIEYLVGSPVAVISVDGNALVMRTTPYAQKTYTPGFVLDERDYKELVKGLKEAGTRLTEIRRKSNNQNTKATYTIKI